ncbi:ParA family protein, partial [Fulvivirga aurantia]|uniref:ParA family protein n=1 Tax=Fulvivirga aurantia TaxID=2529383 RepID=UPI001626D19A
MIISIANEKGGVAKSTSANALASILSRKGYKVILVDLDPQADLTLSLDIECGDRNIFDCIFMHKKVIASKVNDNLVLIGGDPRLTPVGFIDSVKKDQEFELENPRLILKLLLDQIKKKVDFIILDLPPNREIVVQNALAASDYVLIPTEAHSFAANGIHNIIEYIDLFKEKLNPRIDLLGIIVTRYRRNTAIHSDMYEWLKETYPNKLFNTTIAENITIQEATQQGRE